VRRARFQLAPSAMHPHASCIESLSLEKLDCSQLPLDISSRPAAVDDSYAFCILRSPPQVSFPHVLKEFHALRFESIWRSDRETAGTRNVYGEIEQYG
jgi:hypothetical protein